MLYKINKKNINNIIYKKPFIVYKKSLKLNKYFNNIIFIHKGNSFKKLLNSKFLSGLILGLFSFSRKPFLYPKSLKKKKHIRR